MAEKPASTQKGRGVWAPSHGQRTGSGGGLPLPEWLQQSGHVKPASLGWALTLPALPLGPAGAGGCGCVHRLKVSWVMLENKANWSRQGLTWL